MRLHFITMAMLAVLAASPTLARDKASAPSCGDVGQTVGPVLTLIEQRLKLAEDVARHKWNKHGSIEDPAREQAIIGALGRQARREGLPVAWAERFFRAQIEASKAVQRALFAQWQREHVGHFDNVPDLTGITRPKLDALTTKLIAGLAEALPQFRRCRESIVELNKQKLKTMRFSAEAYAVAVEPLLDFEGIGQ